MRPAYWVAPILTSSDRRDVRGRGEHAHRPTLEHRPKRAARLPEAPVSRAPCTSLLLCSPAGHFCPAATLHPVPCPAGQYMPESGAAACQRCEAGQDSLPGAKACTICAEHYYRPNARSSVADCTTCNQSRGFSCGLNATVQTIVLNRGYWRHSHMASTTWRCRRKNDWSPCIGGLDAGHDGDGYCNSSADGGYRGPQCEVCVTSDHFFDKIEARCRACGSVATRTAIAFAVLIFLLVALFVLGWAVGVHNKPQSRCGRLLKRVRSMKELWDSTGMRYKEKALVGLFQCVAAIPSVFGVSAPAGMVEEYDRWLNLMDQMSQFGIDYVVRADCFGSYRR